MGIPQHTTAIGVDVDGTALQFPIEAVPGVIAELLRTVVSGIGRLEDGYPHSAHCVLIRIDQGDSQVDLDLIDTAALATGLAASLRDAVSEFDEHPADPRLN